MSRSLGRPRGNFSSGKACRGFSLVELIVALVILAIMASIAIPSYQAFILQQRVHTATITLQSAMSLTRAEAVKRNEPLTLIAASDGWSSGWTVTAPDGVLILSQPSLPGISIAGNASVRFSRSGRSTASAFSVTATDDTSVTSCLQLEASGRANSHKGGC